MPLQLASTEPTTDAVGNYWNIDDIVMRWAAYSAEVTLGLYVDKAAFDDSRQPLRRVTIILTNEELDALAPTMGLSVYMLLAARPEFEGAELVA